MWNYFSCRIWQDYVSVFIMMIKQKLNRMYLVVYFQMLILQQSKLILHNIWEKWVIYWHSSPCMSKALCRVTSKVFSIYTSSTWRSTAAAAGRVLRGSSEWGGNGVWHVDSGVNPPGLLKRLLLEFNHPAILDTLWSREGWLMSMQAYKLWASTHPEAAINALDGWVQSNDEETE